MILKREMKPQNSNKLDAQYNYEQATKIRFDSIMDSESILMSVVNE